MNTSNFIITPTTFNLGENIFVLLKYELKSPEGFYQYYSHRLTSELFDELKKAREREEYFLDLSDGQGLSEIKFKNDKVIFNNTILNPRGNIKSLFSIPRATFNAAFDRLPSTIFNPDCYI